MKIYIPSYTCVDLSYSCVSIFLMDNGNYENMHSILHLCQHILYLCLISIFLINNGNYENMHSILHLCRPILYLCHPILYLCQPILYLCHPILYLDHNGKEIYKQISCHQIWAPFCCTVLILCMAKIRMKQVKRDHL